MSRIIFAILATVSSVLAADTPPAAAPLYYAIKYEASDKSVELGVGVTYTLWVPPGVKALRGVIVHQHGCGISSGVSGLTAAYDLHWQALAKKWDCALLGPAYHLKANNECRKWCDPRNGSDVAFQKALAHFAAESGHPELTTVPWCLWGHSGGGFWSSLMLTMHPERIAAIFFRSGSAYAIWERGEIPKPTIHEAAYGVPFMFIGGVKEAQDKVHGPPRLGDRAMLKAWREHGAPGGIASDPLSGHECGDSRYLAISFFDACLAQRLSDGGTPKLKPAAKGVVVENSWLPDAAFVKVWESYNKTGRPFDTTPPPAPTKVLISAKGELTWNAEADLESGLGGFVIERDGKELARLPEKPVSKLGTPLFQGMSGGDTPIIAQPPMSYTDPTAKAGETHEYCVISVNAAGLRSVPVTAARSKTVSLLTVGNSFSHNATHYLGDIAKANGDTLILREDNIGGSSFDIHLKKIAEFEKDPTSKRGKYTMNRSLKDDLTREKWDFITIQQSSIKSHNLATYRPYANQLADYIRRHSPGATLLMHQTWEYRVDDPRFSQKTPKPGEPKTQDEMYQGLAHAYATIAKELNVKLIPVGDAFHSANRDPQWGYRAPATPFDSKNAKPGELPDQTYSLNVGWIWRKSTKGKMTLVMDGHHANMAGEYLVACVWYEALFGKSVEGNSFVPMGLDAAYAKFMRATAHRAVTDSK